MFVSTKLSSPESSIKNHNHQFNNFKDWVNFFQDQQISTAVKTEQAENYLRDLIQQVDVAGLEWLDQPRHVEQHFLNSTTKPAQSSSLM